MISEKEKFFDPRKPFQSARPETHEEWQARMGGEVLAVVRSGLYLDFRFLDQALSALTPTADERCGVLATDGTILCYQPSALLRLYQKNPKYLNRLYLHTVFHCIFRHLWLRGRREGREGHIQKAEVQIQPAAHHGQHLAAHAGLPLLMGLRPLGAEFLARVHKFFLWQPDSPP